MSGSTNLPTEKQVRHEEFKHNGVLYSVHNNKFEFSGILTSEFQLFGHGKSSLEETI